MGMYTEFHFNKRLREDVPDNVTAVLKFMLDEEDKPAELPDHPLFQTSRWSFMLGTESYYFDARAHSTLEFDAVTKQFFLCIRCSLKNYDDEIEKFVNWIEPYLDAQQGDFLGFSRYEETEEPTLLFYRGRA